MCHICSQVKAAICRLVYVKGRCNIPSFQKSRHWGRLKRDVTWSTQLVGVSPMVQVSVSKQQDATAMVFRLTNSNACNGTAVVNCFLVLKLPAVGRTTVHVMDTSACLSIGDRDIDDLDLHSNGGGKKCTLLGVISADQNRPPVYCGLHFHLFMYLFIRGSPYF